MLNTAGQSPLLSCWLGWVWCIPGCGLPSRLPGNAADWCLLPASTSRSLSPGRLSSHSSPNLCLCPALLHPRYRIQHLELLNFIPLIIAQCSNLFRSLCKAACPSTESPAPLTLASSANFCSSHLYEFQQRLRTHFLALLTTPLPTSPNPSYPPSKMLSRGTILFLRSNIVLRKKKKFVVWGCKIPNLAGTLPQSTVGQVIIGTLCLWRYQLPPQNSFRT